MAAKKFEVPSVESQDQPQTFDRIRGIDPDVERLIQIHALGVDLQKIAYELAVVGESKISGVVLRAALAAARVKLRVVAS